MRARAEHTPFERAVARLTHASPLFIRTVKYFFDGYCCSPGEIKDAALGPQHPSSLPFGDIVEGCQQLNPPFYTSANSTVLTKSVHRNISVFNNVAKVRAIAI